MAIAGRRPPLIIGSYRIPGTIRGTVLVGGMLRWGYDIGYSMLDQGYGIGREDVMMVLRYRVQYVRPRLRYWYGGCYDGVTR